MVTLFRTGRAKEAGRRIDIGEQKKVRWCIGRERNGTKTFYGRIRPGGIEDVQGEETVLCQEGKQEVDFQTRHQKHGQRKRLHLHAGGEWLRYWVVIITECSARSFIRMA